MYRLVLLLSLLLSLSTRAAAECSDCVGTSEGACQEANGVCHKLLPSGRCPPDTFVCKDNRREPICIDTQQLDRKLSDEANLYSSFSNTAAFADSHTRWFKDTDYPYAQPSASMVLRPATADDIVNAMEYVTSNDLDLAVRSGGHGNGGKFLTEGGFLLDMRSMNAVTYDPNTTHVTVQGGAILNDITDALKEFGRSPPLGICRGVGAGILHGGWGASARKYGLTIDSVVSAMIVTPDGELRYVDADNESDLFWGIRGDVSNFGVLVSVTYKTFDATAGGFSFVQQVLPLDALPKAAKYMNTQMPDRDVGGILVVVAGQLVQFLWVWNDDIDLHLADQDIEPLFPAFIGTGYFEFQDFFYAFSDNFPTYSFGRSECGSFTFTGNATDDEFLSAFQATFPEGSTGSGLFEMWAGAIEDVAPEATAFYPRSQQFVWYVNDYWTDPLLTEVKIETLKNISAELNASPGASPDLYINYVDNSDESLENGFGTNRDRLKLIKQQYDPDNVMTHSFNVK